MNVVLRHLLQDEAFDAARHGGFDILVEKAEDWLIVGCEYPPRLVISIEVREKAPFAVETSDRALSERLASEIPLSGLAVDDLRRVCSRAYAILRAMPSGPLDHFCERTRGMPQTTEVERLAVQRVGQDLFRSALEDYWGSSCPLTGVTDREMLRASHIRAWADCESDAERLDVFNGFLLAAHLDAAFDRHLMSLDASGAVVFSPRLSARGRAVIEATLIAPGLRLDARHERFLGSHRKKTMAGVAGTSKGS